MTSVTKTFTDIKSHSCDMRTTVRTVLYSILNLNQLDTCVDGLDNQIPEDFLCRARM